MVIIRDEARIARLRKISQIISLIGMVALIAGLVIIFTGDIEDVFWYQFIALLIGWLGSQVGVYLAQRYVRRPRPDEVLDEALGKVAKNGRLYHYVLPAPHVLLTPEGVIVLLPKFQVGQISYEAGKWKQRGIGLSRRLFGQEGLGNPEREVDAMLRAMAGFISKNAPSVAEISMAAIIVFTSKGVELDVADSPIPALHYKKVKGFYKQNQGTEKLPQADYVALRTAFDAAAGELVTDGSGRADPH